MEHSPYSQADSYLTGQDIPRLLWYPKFHYPVHKEPQLGPIASP